MPTDTNITCVIKTKRKPATSHLKGSRNLLKDDLLINVAILKQEITVMAVSDILVARHATLPGHVSDVTWVDFSFNMLATCSSDKTVRLWDVSNFEDGVTELPQSPLLGHRYTVHCCCFSSFGNILATCSMDGYIILWDPKTGTMIETLQHPSTSSIRVCKFSSNSSYLATGSEDDTLVIWDVLTRKIFRTLKGHDASVTACSFTPDSNFIISGSTNGDLRLWDIKRGSDLATNIEGHDLGVMACEFSPVVGVQNSDSCRKRYLLATCGNDDAVRLFNIAVGIDNEISLDTALHGHEGNVMCCRFSSNGKLLASASGDKTVIIWNVSSRSMLVRLMGHQRYVTSCAFSFQNNYIASGSNDKTIILWQIKENKLDLLAPSSPVKDLIDFGSPVKQTVKDDAKTPHEFFCPITHEVMKDPVIASDGFSYERKAILEWLQSGKASSPMTNQKLSYMQLTPNYALKMLIQRHLDT
ncbi:hypothetical protein CHUAL_002183 [Chamberlinius hualienensis]